MPSPCHARYCEFNDPEKFVEYYNLTADPVRTIVLSELGRLYRFAVSPVTDLDD